MLVVSVVNIYLWNKNSFFEYYDEIIFVGAFVKFNKAEGLNDTYDHALTEIITS